MIKKQLTKKTKKSKDLNGLRLSQKQIASGNGRVLKSLKALR